MAVFWVVAPRRLVEVFWRFKGACCLHHQGDRPYFIQFMIFSDIAKRLILRNIKWPSLPIFWVLPCRCIQFPRLPLNCAVQPQSSASARFHHRPRAIILPLPAPTPSIPPLLIVMVLTVLISPLPALMKDNITNSKVHHYSDKGPPLKQFLRYQHQNHNSSNLFLCDLL
jgi:hypothetical protein